ncbi:MAG: response regulator [Phyllobacterium sp.]|uniref:response regulator n=1 Tax=Phyllobacterium sp. TaxID=1871046 RepID=UPI0030F336ED
MNKGAKILVVEDEGLLAMMVQEMLEELGYEVPSVASTLSEGVSLVATGTFDAAILDISLHGEKSFPIAELLVEMGIPFAFSSGFSLEDVEPDYAARPLLRKPYQLAELERILAAL